jgi:signal transduction histidine kinase
MHSAGLGLRNTHARLLALGSKGLEIAENAPQGLRVSFLLPLAAPYVEAAPVHETLKQPEIPAINKLQEAF